MAMATILVTIAAAVAIARAVFFFSDGLDDDDHEYDDHDFDHDYVDDDFGDHGCDDCCGVEADAIDIATSSPIIAATAAMLVSDGDGCEYEKY